MLRFSACGVRTTEHFSVTHEVETRVLRNTETPDGSRSLGPLDMISTHNSSVLGAPYAVRRSNEYLVRPRLPQISLSATPSSKKRTEREDRNE